MSYAGIKQRLICWFSYESLLFIVVVVGLVYFTMVEELARKTSLKETSSQLRA